MKVIVCAVGAATQVGVPTVLQAPLVQDRVALPLWLAVEVDAVDVKPLATPGML